MSDIVNPFFPEVIKSFETPPASLATMRFSAIRITIRAELEAAERMMEHKVRGVAIMTSEISSRLIKELERRRIAVTFLDLAPVRGYVSKLRIDYASGMNKSWISLWLRPPADRVYRRTAKAKSNLARLEAYEKCMQELGLQPGPIVHGDLRFEGGLAAGLSIAKRSPGPTAVMAVNNLTAVGVIKGLLKGGCRVPQDFR